MGPTMKASSYRMQGVRGSGCTRLGSPLARAQGKRPSSRPAARLQHHARLVTGQAAFVLRAASSDVESSGTSTKSSSILKDCRHASTHERPGRYRRARSKERETSVRTHKRGLPALLDGLARNLLHTRRNRGCQPKTVEAQGQRFGENGGSG